MVYLLKLLFCCLCLTTLNVKALKADGSFEDAEQVNEFITMSFSSSHPYDLRQTIPGEPEIDYPIYSAVPSTNFDCTDRHEGYYADTEARCQVFRICANTDLVGKGFAFLCPNGTLFSQKNFVCDWYRNVDCNESERFYNKNDNNRIGTKTDMMKTVRQMMEHPMKTISVALNRGKSTTSKPALYSNFATSTKKPSINFQTSSTPASRLPIQDNFNKVKQPQTENQIDIDLRFSPSLQASTTTGEKIHTTSPSERGFKPSNAAASITPPSPTFTPPFETPLLQQPYEGPLSSADDSFETYSPAPQAGSLFSPTEDSASEKKVYISSLGELSTDPGANFNRQTSRIISDPPSNALEITETARLNGSELNFAEKVNAGLHGLQVVNHDGILAPDYVKNIMQQQNNDYPSDIIQPVPFDFASNVNSLLEEVTYEAEAEGPHSVQYQQQTLPIEESTYSTKKPFRFLSRGFSHENLKGEGSYLYEPTPATRSLYRTTQHSTSTKSFSNSLFTTLLATTQNPVLPTSEITQILTLDITSEHPKIESSDELNIETSSVESDQSINLVEQENRLNTSETFLQEDIIGSQTVEIPDFDVESELHSKPAVKREQKELKQLDSVGSLKDPSPESKNDDRTNSELEQRLHSKPAIKREQKELKNFDSPDALNDTPVELMDDEDKVNANKRAEDLLLAGVKQISVNGPNNDEQSKTTENVPIVPIYNRVLEPQTSTPHITPSSTTSTISKSTQSIPTSTPYVSSTTSDIPSTSPPSTTTTVTSTTVSTSSEPTTTPAVTIRRFTVGSGNRRQTSKPLSYSRRNNLPRSGKRTTTSTTRSTSTTTAPTYRNRLGLRSTSTTPASSTIRITTAPRKRLNTNRFTYGNRRRTTESSISTSSTTTTTTIAPPTKKLTVRSSDSDLTAVASTYNASPNRAYNSIRQNSYKYAQTKRRRPASHKNNTFEITTTKPLSLPKTSTIQQPRSPSSTYPTPTLAPFSHHEVLSSMSISPSTTPEPLPATFLSFNDLTKSITDDSILQTLRKNQDFNRQLIDSPAFRNQQQASPKQQIPFSTAPRIQQVLPTQRPPLPVATSLPFIPLKDFIASKFGSQYSPEPPKLSTTRPSLITPGINSDFAQKIQTKPIYDQHQYSKQQYQNNKAVKVSAPVLPQLNQNVYQQKSQLNVQQQQYQDQQLRLQLQQQQQKLQQLKQQQNHLQQQYQLQQQQKLQQQQQQQNILQQQQQQQQSPPQQYYSTNQQQIFPTQQYTQLHQTTPQQQQQQKISIHQQVSTKIIPSIEQQFEIQRSQQIQQPITLTSQQQLQQIQIIPSQMTMAQTIRPQHSNIQSEIGSINVRLPSNNLAGLIPNTNIFDSSRNSNSLESAHRRSDQAFEHTYYGAGGARERKSVFAGVSSYDVPLSSVGRLANDVTHLLRQRRL